MKVLLVISSYKNGFPYIQDLERKLKTQEISVSVLDIESLFLINNDGSISEVADSFTLKFILKVPKVRTGIRVFLLKRYFKKLKGKYDAIGIHSCDLIYIHLIEGLRKISKNLSVTIWGSDFYRASDLMRQRKKKVFDLCDLIVFGNPSNQYDFVSYYKDYYGKSVVCGFGITKFDIIKKVLEHSKKQEVKSSLGLPTNKLIVAIGYNGTVQQQHEMLIDCLTTLPKTLKEKIFLLFQMSYGGNEEYRKQVEKKAKACGINYKLITHFLSDEETSKIRIATDIVLNAQLTDGFSASIQEHLFAKNVVIVGSWLEYKSLDQSNIFYLKSSKENFGRMSFDVIENYSKYSQLIENNTEKIYELSSWDSRLSDWIAIYKGTVKKQNATPQL